MSTGAQFLIGIVVGSVIGCVLALLGVWVYVVRKWPRG